MIRYYDRRRPLLLPRILYIPVGMLFERVWEWVAGLLQK